MNTAELVRSRLVAVKWVQAKLTDTAPACSHELAAFLNSAGDRTITSLCSAQTFHWLDTMIHLIDRNAPDLLPDGQFAAHAASVVNLTAGLADAEWTNVRFNEFGHADLPSLGVRVDGGPKVAGQSATLNLSAPGLSVTVTALPEPVRPPTEPAASAANSPNMPWAGPPPIEAILGRWVGEGRALAADRIRPGLAAAEGALADLLGAAAIPATIVGNYGGTEEIRQDSTFDHLSLLSVRHPGQFATVSAAAVAAESNRLARRIVGHVHYIERRYAQAAAVYASLLLEDVEDLDLWRDYCWAKRHNGSEEITRCWVMHPLEVTAVAHAVAFDDQSGDPDEVLARFLEWMSNDLG